MNRWISAAFLVAVSGLMASSAAADGAEGKNPANELDCLVGTWKGTGRLVAGGETHTVQGEYTCRKSSGGLGVACHLTMTGIPGMTYESDDLWGYDPGTGNYHWFTVTNAGETHDHKGRIEGSSFIASYVGRRDGKPMRENVRMSLAGEDKLSAKSTVFVARQKMEEINVTFNKVSAGARASR